MLKNEKKNQFEKAIKKNNLSQPIKPTTWVMKSE
jgi:hypothetical protein